MDSYKKPVILSTFFALLFAITLISNAQINVKVMVDEVIIYTEQNIDTSSTIRTTKGDIFEVTDVQDGWTQIHLFSGEERFIKSSQVSTIHEIPPYPSYTSVRKDLCAKVKKASSKASKNSLSKYPNTIDQQSSYEYFLFDKYVLDIYRTSDIPASNYSKLIE
ncbi:hypothetical protein LQ318_03915 [Aliifodinibius salicampi]|uniref:SH3 domain-containing protein n=1 Tax=Fodinibius salicampi TaxID=1920655 RepID=A0ABT3PW21_9BACT|nr:hypothetical protein [Fodinibius salicampi]MCW9712043.1 hypothetical protein [Fodinibius salicampi]